MKGSQKGPTRRRRSTVLLLAGSAAIGAAALWTSVLVWPNRTASALSRAECKRRGCKFSTREWKCICPKRPRPRPRRAPYKGGPMVTIKGRCFNMGARWGDYASRPLHKVCLNTFSIDKYEVTVKDYAKCVQSGNCTPPNAYSALQSWTKKCNWGATGRRNHPVNCLSWYQARVYCRWAKKRLPTEAEWEYAARGQDGRRYTWGNQTPACGRAVVLFRNKKCRAGSGTMAVGSARFGGSPFGVMDMMGNVWEWVEDCYDSRFYKKCGRKCRNPVYKCTGSRRRTLRGGSYLTTSWTRTFSTYYRGADKPTKRVSSYGFRCASSRRQRWSGGMIRNWCRKQGCGYDSRMKGCRCGPGMWTTAVPVAAKGRLNVRSNVRGAEVFLNGVRLGRAPLSRALKTGTYSLEVRKAGTISYRKSVTVNRAKTTHVYATLVTPRKTQCVGGAILVSGRCVCPSGTVWNTRLARCMRLTVSRPSVIRGGPMVTVRAGCPWMGSPRKRVCLTKFSIDKYEVTVNDYAKCVRARGCTAPGTYQARHKVAKHCNWGKYGRKYNPINCVNWYQARKYCTWAGKRLPTNAEWQWAALAGRSWLYPWGNLSPSCKHGVFKLCWSFGGGTWPVGRTTKGRSYWGAFDMAGNVAEWVEDCYSNLRLSSCGSTCRNPVFRCTSTNRIVRGGSWIYRKLNVYATPYVKALSKYTDAGFRCARNL